MRYLVFSDSHLTHKFDPKKFAVLKEAISQADRVIINGDFWDGYTSDFGRFAESEWKNTLFPLLKQKQAIYIYGNHDKRDMHDERVSLFSVKRADSMELKSGKYKFHIEHGHELYPLGDETHGIKSKYVYFVTQRIEDFLIRTFGKLFTRRLYGSWNVTVKKKLRDSKTRHVTVMGHTHFQEIDLENKLVNSGFVDHGLAQYIYIEDGTITQVEKRY